MAFDRFMDKVGKRLNKRENTTIVIVGDPRSGKSTLAFRLAKEFSRRFGGNFTNEHVHFYARDLVKDFRASERTAIIFDDAGYQYDPQRWYAKTAHAVKIIQETHGIKLNFLIITVQSLGLLLEAGISLSTFVFDCRVQGRAWIIKINSKHLTRGFWWKDLHWNYDYRPLDNDSQWLAYETIKREFLERNSMELDKEMELEEMKHELRFRKTQVNLNRLENNPQLLQLRQKLAMSSGIEYKTALKEYLTLKEGGRGGAPMKNSE